MCISQTSPNDVTAKHPNISATKTQTLSASTEDNRFPFDPLHSKHTAKEDDNISTTSLPSTPTVAAPEKQVNLLFGKLELNCYVLEA